MGLEDLHAELGRLAACSKPTDAGPEIDDKSQIDADKDADAKSEDLASKMNPAGRATAGKGKGK